MWSQIKDAGGCWYTTYGGLGIFNHARGYFGRVTTLPMARLRCWVLCWRLGENEAPSVSHTVCGNCWVMGENRHKNLSTTFQSEEDKWHDFLRYQCCKISCASFMKQNNGSSRVFFDTGASRLFHACQLVASGEDGGFGGWIGGHWGLRSYSPGNDHISPTMPIESMIFRTSPGAIC